MAALIVGNTDYSFAKIIKVITKNNDYPLSGPGGDWNKVADALEFFGENRKRLETDLKFGFIRLSGVLENVLTNWRLQEGEKATVYRLIYTLERNGLIDISNNLWEEFELKSEEKGKVLEAYFHQCFATSKICIQNITCKPQDIFNPEQLQLCERVVRSHLPHATFYDFFINNKCELKLIKNTKPALPTFHIPRKLSNRYIVDKKVFQNHNLGPDLFVFWGLQRYELSILVKQDSSINQHYTVSSHLYFENPDVYQIVHLEEGFENNWESIRKTRNPAHLLNYESDTKKLILKSTCGNSNILHKYVYLDREQCTTEDEVISKVNIESGISNGVCFCDIFGSGKTETLKYLAAKLPNNNPKQMLVFISVETFKDFLKKSKSKIKLNFPLYFSKILEYISISDESLRILAELIEFRLLKMHLFIDDIDKQEAEYISKAIEMLKFIKSYENIRVYVTCRPQTRKLVEEALDIKAYNIMPLSEVGQVDLLVKTWLDNIQPKKSLNILRDELKILANQYLQIVENTFGIKTNNIMGIPNFCKIFGQVYQTVACYCTNTPKGFVDYSLKNPPLNIFNAYKTYIELCLDTSVTCTSIKFQQKCIISELCPDVIAFLFKSKNQQNQQRNELRAKVKWWHTLLALHKQFPEICDTIQNQTNDKKYLILSACLLQDFQIRGELSNDFLDITIAEYFIASFLADNFSKTSDIERKPFSWFLQGPISLFSRASFKNNESGRVIGILRNLAAETINFSKNHSIKLYFLNAFIKNSKLQDKKPDIVQFFCEEVPPKSYYLLLKYCLLHNLEHIFCFIKSILTSAGAERKTTLTHQNVSKLLATAARYTNIHLFKECIYLAQKFVVSNVFSLCSTRNDFLGPETPTPLELAVEMGTYDVVEYLFWKCDLTNRNLLRCCVANTANVSAEILNKKVNILCLLLNINKFSLSELPKQEWDQLNIHTNLLLLMK